VGLSGGVDSSVAAALLKEQGFDVTGIFIKCWSPEFAGFSSAEECPWEQDQKDAEDVAKKLGVPFKSLNLEKEYWERVSSPTIQDYARGLTPNPDVLCNKEIKFGLFLEYALRQGADLIATGHYVKKSADNSLLCAEDINKDQSYFLWMLNRVQLEKCLFPIGDYTKQEVRDMARKYALPTAEKSDSQGICFVGNVPIRQFLKHYIEERPGEVVTLNGKVVGRHEGVAFYTIGQRRGIGSFGGEAPYYVTKKDLSANTITVVPPSQIEQLYQDKLVASNTNWISGLQPVLPLKCFCRIRYRQELQKCTIVDFTDGYLQVEFSKPQRGIAEGQSIVFYDKDVVIGGAIIHHNFT